MSTATTQAAQHETANGTPSIAGGPANRVKSSLTPNRRRRPVDLFPRFADKTSRSRTTSTPRSSPASYTPTPAGSQAATLTPWPT